MDESGVRVVEYIYDAWGKLISTTGTLSTTLGADNPFRYRGYYYDTEIGVGLVLFLFILLINAALRLLSERSAKA